jgi:DNA-binding NarL/FixJ family response regulator
MAENKAVRVLIVEDEFILSRNLEEILNSFEFSVVGVADSSEVAIEACENHVPDLILMDIHLRGEISGIQAVKVIWEKFRIPSIYLTGHSDIGTATKASESISFGYLLKPIKESALYPAIAQALQMAQRMRSLETIKSKADAIARELLEISDSLAKPSEIDPGLLTERQRQVLIAIAQGSTNKEIAGSLGISEKTVESHKAELSKALGFSGTANFTKYAVRMKLVH